MLKMQPTDLGPDNGRKDYTVRCSNWEIGRIYEVSDAPPAARWFWSFHAMNGPMERYGRTATFEEAKTKFAASWEAWKDWTGLVERE
jgi:hypothetical protein